MAAAERPSIYQAARRIKRRDYSLYNALRSIYHDSVFVAEIAGLWPALPLLANLRCGFWYSPHFDATCYFKSTDGHQNNCTFSTARLNLHVARLAGQKGGCIVVDSTRKGKRFPDSMSKTIPIWACVLNRVIRKLLQRERDCQLLQMWTSTVLIGIPLYTFHYGSHMWKKQPLRNPLMNGPNFWKIVVLILLLLP